MIVHHIAFADDWLDAVAAGSYRVSTRGIDLAEVGFIHCSTPDQLESVRSRHYAGVTEPLVLLTIDTDLLGVPWQLDDVPGEPSPYPHVYGPIVLAAVVSTEPTPAG